MDGFFSIAQISSELGVSKVTIYSKLKLLDSKVKKHLKVVEGVTYVDEAGFVLIKSSLNLKPKKVKSFKGADMSVVLSLKDEQIEMLKKELEYFKDDVKVKNDLIRNFQILLKQKEDRILQLESPKNSLFKKFQLFLRGAKND